MYVESREIERKRKKERVAQRSEEEGGIEKGREGRRSIKRERVER